MNRQEIAPSYTPAYPLLVPCKTVLGISESHWTTSSSWKSMAAAETGLWSVAPGAGKDFRLQRSYRIGFLRDHCCMVLLILWLFLFGLETQFCSLCKAEVNETHSSPITFSLICVFFPAATYFTFVYNRNKVKKKSPNKHMEKSPWSLENFLWDDTLPHALIYTVQRKIMGALSQQSKFKHLNHWHVLTHTQGQSSWLVKRHNNISQQR